MMCSVFSRVLMKGKLLFPLFIVGSGEGMGDQWIQMSVA